MVSLCIRVVVSIMHGLRIFNVCVWLCVMYSMTVNVICVNNPL
jgi:hypothetical protein